MKPQTLEALRREGAFVLAGTSDNPGTDAHVLLAHALGITTESMLANLHTCYTPAQYARYGELLKRRTQGVPTAYILGSREFMSLPFIVNENVLVPRADTETLVELVLGMHKRMPFSRGLEIGTGSGCISVSLAHHGKINMLAADISITALRVAKLNVSLNKMQERVTLVRSNMFASISADDLGAFHFVVSNPPYIPTADIDTLGTDVREHEPRLALDGGETGLDFYERLAAQSARWLLPRGMLFMEIGYDQREAVKQLLLAYGWTDIYCAQDLAGHDRVVFATRAKTI